MLIGRDPELAKLDQMLAAIGRGEAAWLRVSGEPGIGKSSLLAALTDRANEQGMLVLSGRAAEFERDRAFGPVVDAIDAHLRDAGDQVTRSLSPAERELLAQVVPSLSTNDGAADVLAAERYRIHRAIGSLLRAITSTAPVVLVLDDTHWADEATNELLAHLLLAAPIPRLLVATADRPTQLATSVRSTFERGALDGVVTVVALSGLAPADAERLLRERMDPERRSSADLVAKAAEAAGGNPLYLVALARHGEPAAASDRDGDLPAGLLAVVGRELDALSPEERGLAQGGAVAGDPFDVRDAATAAGIGIEDALALVDRLVAFGLVGPTSQTGRFAFRHPIVRQATYGSTGPGWRIGAHRRLADALLANDADPVEVARHLAITAERGDLTAFATFGAAGDALAVTAPSIAAERFADALRVLPLSAEPGVRVATLAKQAEALRSVGRLGESRAALREAIAQLSEGDVADLVRLSAACGSLEHQLGMVDEAHDTLRDALASVPDPSSAHAAAVLAELALNAGFYRSDFPDLEHYSARALEVARLAGDHGTEAMALALRSFAAFNIGQVDEAAAALGTAADLIDDLPDRELTERLGALGVLARSEFYLDRNEEGIRHAERGIRLCRSSGRTHHLIAFRLLRGSLLSVAGRARDALAESRDALDAARLTGVDQTVFEAVLEQSWIETRMGDLDAALAACDEATTISARLPKTYLVTSINWSKASVYLERDEPQWVIDVLVRPADGSRIEDAPMPGPLLAWHLLARAEARCGRVDEARTWLRRIDDGLPLVASLTMPWVWQKRASAAILLAQGEARGAAEMLEESAAEADAGGLAFEGSVSRRLAGLAWAAADERELAIEQLDQARREFERYGVARQQDAITRELRRLGVRIGRSGRRSRGDDGDGMGSLSDREREIAELVAEGRTNKEIGDALFISTRTVERHLSHVFDKLGVDARSQLGALVERTRA